MKKAKSEAINKAELENIAKQNDEFLSNIDLLFDKIIEKKRIIMFHPDYERQNNDYLNFSLKEIKKEVARERRIKANLSSEMFARTMRSLGY